MTSKALLDGILRLPVEERLELIEEIWDSLAADADQVPVAEWHRRELERRLQNLDPQHVPSAEVHGYLKRQD